jgi:hypothetical protein
VITNDTKKEVAVPNGAEIDCGHWLCPSHEVIAGVDVPHWSVNLEGENDE